MQGKEKQMGSGTLQSALLSLFHQFFKCSHSQIHVCSDGGGGGRLTEQRRLLGEGPPFAQKGFLKIRCKVLGSPSNSIPQEGMC